MARVKARLAAEVLKDLAKEDPVNALTFIDRWSKTTRK